MEKSLPVIKNQVIDVRIESMGYHGEGIAKIDGFPIFIEEAIDGELVKVKIIKVKSKYAYGKIMEIIEPSNERREPKCNLYNRCGGCNLQHLSYEGQLQFKTNRVLDCITRIGNVKGVIMHPTLGMEDPYSYRNKVQLPVGINKTNSNNGVSIGFFAARSHEIINMNVCYIQDEVADKIIKYARRWMFKYNIKPYDEEKNEGLIRHIMVRKGFVTGEVMVVLVTNGIEIPDIKPFIDVLKKNVEGVTSIVQNINTKRTNVILGDKCKTLWGKGHIRDYIGKFEFNISPLSFYQVNPVQTEVLYNKALEYAELTGEETVFDAYCGTGTISLFLSQKAKKVYGVEIVPEAIKDAKKNAEQNNVKNAEFIVGEAEKIIPNMINEGIKADVVVVDPPRKGCDVALINALGEMRPKRIVYVSCDPATLARDLKFLEEKGYETVEVQPVDMFPQTAHIESVVKLELK
ncbi:23S rRNA (uracil(1939)-C(5))-methyltransferase RlmD [Oceanirhabdus sp. W0125-5]|uniref:23S rRNA (uracil(1939)-C(5))-methyltransferase RlmD n=1 Tax=Oceanirhabdus sp. W0125-5 TaxID=2999116 RepID=UPI0022F2DE2F|nr:23S rRNA (uracil(1939)-C(5))-methyltransferase RlmD [Oceanirhabdus sp. W0125-5]WBW99306.1 23S rRNA (uracil(1939)-C(5))-methyltransferase RlmD [Oceanirhabdus sp. W0125-5]